ncbi:MAG: mannose-1-phosphate guanylyltransferase [Bacteroidetes bacterium 4484_249]|nr:MAG: mannose-1-phosphate guanylyltransferase [Bacteroidetes bacterium 4484_249]RLD74505.1 MAG: mannose-1-phosphate guanylyltransferase [Bacteroidota bacterium]
MDAIDKKLLFVFHGKRFLNILSVGDIQRAILKNTSLETSVEKVLRKNTQTANSLESIEYIKERMAKFRMECMPIINDNGELVEVYFWEDLFPSGEKRKVVNLRLPVVIMAGGEGTRLKPLTNVLPKPLIPIGNKTILEHIMDRFIEVGCNRFYFSVNYKAEMIKHYFKILDHSAYQISYFEESKPLGTAGSLSLLKDKIDKTFFVSNCDIIIDAEYDEILNYHKKNGNELTVVSALKNYSIPYGTIETGKNGTLTGLKEKPELTFQINSGLYILEPYLLNEIPENEYFQITTLINNIIGRKGKVGVFPVSVGSWKDIGNWDEYLKNN